MLADLLRPLSCELAEVFVDLRTPVPLDVDTAGEADRSLPDLGDASTSIVILAGPEATRAQSALHALADHLGAPVANTWGAKGIYPWDDPHHMGTCGLQRDDFSLLGFGEFDVVLMVGVDELEAKPDRSMCRRIESVHPAALDALRSASEPRSILAGDNQLYTRMAAIAQPGYADDSFPRHPARAVVDLKQSLAAGTRVTAQPGLTGLWVARTFPTDRMGSVIVPAVEQPGIGAAVGLASAAQGTDTVGVVEGPVDEVTAEVMTVAEHHELPLRLEVWEEDVDWSRTAELIAAAGPVVAWT